MPVVLFIALGFVVARLRWMSPVGVKELGNLVFLVLTPALLFRTMGQVHLDQLNFEAVGIYFVAAGVVFFGVLAGHGLTCVGAARALACTFGNTIMIGVPLIGMLYGEAGQVQLFTLISIHSLVLLTGATVVFELAAARERAQGGDAAPMWRTVLRALRNGILHPIPLPIIAGLVWSGLGLPLPEVIDKPLSLMGLALGPLSLLLVGATLAQATVGRHLKVALAMAGVKNAVFPALMLGLGWWLGLRGLPLAVMTCAAALPTGANVFMFAQRYNTGADEITAEVATSTVLALLSMPLVLMALVAWVPVA
ncbi:transporter [Comamonas serinivorans]|uniref:Transporter n=1 Tax=Comamonas serinivorans TaxID=1082851 RepID=A0A1Y0EP38_9BURK|nr:AEC family transporter [Comamonas serinivorans]ARU05405.1 transporter [Comamonas serinivorans]